MYNGRAEHGPEPRETDRPGKQRELWGWEGGIRRCDSTAGEGVWTREVLNVGLSPAKLIDVVSRGRIKKVSG